MGNYQGTRKRIENNPPEEIIEEILYKLPVRIENNLPDEIIEEILYELPVKSLLRFKCVSKQWRSLISSTRFTKQHLKKRKSSKDSDFDHHYHLLVSDCISQLRIRSCSLRSIFHEPDNLSPFSLLRSSEPNIFESSYLRSLASTDVNVNTIRILDVQILGSCNGLILISMNRDNELFIWNPATRQVNKIIAPAFPCVDTPYGPIWNLKIGFGYDESTDDYKVVMINQDLDDSYQTHIYSCRTGSWKKIEFSTPTCYGSGKFVNGKLHWMMAVREENIQSTENVNGWEIVSLDLVEEEYEIVARPEHLSIHVVSQPLLKDLGGCLSLICKSATWEINVWVMMQYGDAQSWTKIWKFRDSSDLDEWMPRAMPLWLLKNGDLAVAFGSDVLVYNGQDELRKSRVSILNSGVDSTIYFESLVSPFGDEELSQ